MDSRVEGKYLHHIVVASVAIKGDRLERIDRPFAIHLKLVSMSAHRQVHHPSKLPT